MGRQLMRLHEMKVEVKKVEISSNGHGKEITVCYGKDVCWEEVLEECVKAFKLMDSDCLKKNELDCYSLKQKSLGNADNILRD